jgi:hypothetical protein
MVLEKLTVVRSQLASVDRVALFASQWKRKKSASHDKLPALPGIRFNLEHFSQLLETRKGQLESG